MVHENCVNYLFGICFNPAGGCGMQSCRMRKDCIVKIIRKGKPQFALQRENVMGIVLSRKK